MLKKFVNSFIKPQVGDDPGFGSQGIATKSRLIDKSGDILVHKTGVKFFQKFQLYHWLTGMPWYQFVFILGIAFFVANTFFAVLYFLCGEGAIEETHGLTDVELFWKCFFFSSQTLTTVGFGKLNPSSFLANVISAVESMVGLLGFAVGTGLLYGRFAKPHAKIIFSEKALVSPYREGKGFMFRLANVSASQLLELSVNVTFSILSKDRSKREYTNLELERSSINVLATNWTVVHPIVKSSPFAIFEKEELEDLRAEIIIQLKGFEERFNTHVFSRTSYRASEIIWDAKFESMLSEDEEGLRMEMNKLSSYSLGE